MVCLMETDATGSAQRPQAQDGRSALEPSGTRQRDAVSPAGEPTLIVVGQRAALGPLRRDLIPTYQRWMTDLEVLRGLGQRAVYGIEAEQAFFEQAVKAENAAHFTVYDVSDLTPVGSASLFKIDHANGIADFGIFIGERRGSGIGTEATRLVLDWGFTMLGLHNIMLQVFSWNTRAMRAYAKAGFKEVGRRRGSIVCFGKRYDDVIMDALASEFTGSVLAAMAPEGGAPR
jgi:diamine N-acetyltransferase